MSGTRNAKGKTRNKFEASIHKQLKRLSPVPVGYEDTSITYTPPVKKRRYTPDFTLHFDKPIYIESKGYFRPEAQRKMKAVKKEFPELDIRIVFQRDQPIRKGAKLTYSKWAEKNGFPWAIGDVPEAWMLKMTKDFHNESD